jgi:hypothetical protein
MFLLLPPAASGRMAEVVAEASGEQEASEAAMGGCGADEGGGGCSVQTRHRKAGGMAGRWLHGAGATHKARALAAAARSAREG